MLNEILSIYKNLLPLTAQFNSEESLKKSIEICIEKNCYTILRKDNKIIGFVESYRINEEQAEHLIARSKWLENHLEPFPVPFFLDLEDLENGNISWVEQVVLLPEYRHSEIFKLYREYRKKTKGVTAHIGHRLGKKFGKIIILGSKNGKFAKRNKNNRTKSNKRKLQSV